MAGISFALSANHEISPGSQRGMKMLAKEKGMNAQSYDFAQVQIVNQLHSFQTNSMPNKVQIQTELNVKKLSKDMERYQDIKQVQKATKSCQKRYANIRKYKVCRVNQCCKQARFISSFPGQLPFQ